MEKLRMVMVTVLALSAALYGENGDPGVDPSLATPRIEVTNDITTTQNQSVSASGGSSQSDSFSNASVNLSTSSVSNYETRTAPLTSLPPYLPYWTHGGWGTVKAYFPNGPTINDQIYETTFDPENPDDMRELRSVLRTLPHDGLLEAVGGALNSVAVVLFGSVDKYHHGRGLEIVNSVTRDRRPEGKPLLVFIDSNVDMSLLAEEGYAYVGKVNVEGDVDRNWDQAYKTAVTEALLWDVDILLVSGGMKGVTVGSNFTFPSAAAGYSQMNYSLSLFGAKATGITEGKGKAVLSADAYRFSPGTVERRRIPASLYDRIRLRPRPAPAEPADAGAQLLPKEPMSLPAFKELTTSQGTTPEEPATIQAPAAKETATVRATPPKEATTAQPVAPLREIRGPGITVSRELYDMAGFQRDQVVGSVNIR